MLDLPLKNPRTGEVMIFSLEREGSLSTVLSQFTQIFPDFPLEKIEIYNARGLKLLPHWTLDFLLTNELYREGEILEIRELGLSPSSLPMGGKSKDESPSERLSALAKDIAAGATPSFPHQDSGEEEEELLLGEIEQPDYEDDLIEDTHDDMVMEDFEYQDIGKEESTEALIGLSLDDAEEFALDPEKEATPAPVNDLDFEEETRMSVQPPASSPVTEKGEPPTEKKKTFRKLSISFPSKEEKPEEKSQEKPEEKPAPPGESLGDLASELEPLGGLASGSGALGGRGTQSQGFLGGDLGGADKALLRGVPQGGEAPEEALDDLMEEMPSEESFAVGRLLDDGLEPLSESDIVESLKENLDQKEAYFEDIDDEAPPMDLVDEDDDDDEAEAFSEEEVDEEPMKATSAPARMSRSRSSARKEMEGQWDGEKEMEEVEEAEESEKSEKAEEWEAGEVLEEEEAPMKPSAKSAAPEIDALDGSLPPEPSPEPEPEPEYNMATEIDAQGEDKAAREGASPLLAGSSTLPEEEEGGQTRLDMEVVDTFTGEGVTPAADLDSLMDDSRSEPPATRAFRALQEASEDTLKEKKTEEEPLTKEMDGFEGAPEVELSSNEIEEAVDLPAAGELASPRGGGASAKPDTFFDMDDGEVEAASAASFAAAIAAAHIDAAGGEEAFGAVAPEGSTLESEEKISVEADRRQALPSEDGTTSDQEPSPPPPSLSASLAVSGPVAVMAPPPAPKAQPAPTPAVVSDGSLPEEKKEDQEQEREQESPRTAPDAEKYKAPEKKSQKTEVPKKEEPREVAEGTHLERKTTVRYFSQMHPAQNFPLLVVISKEEIEKIQMARVVQKTAEKAFVIKKVKPIVQIIPHFPGCICTPGKMSVNVTPERVEAKMWVTPLCNGDLKDARVEIWYEGSLVNEVKTPTRVATQTVAKIMGTMSFCAPFIASVLQGFNLDPQSQIKEGFPLLKWILQVVTLPYITLISLLFFVGLALFFYLRNRPQEADPVTEFFGVKARESKSMEGMEE